MSEPNKDTEAVKCEECNGTGKEICTNPDHGFIHSMPGDIGRLGCPCCGHDEDHAIRNTVCEKCKGTGEEAPQPTPTFAEAYKNKTEEQILEIAKEATKMQIESLTPTIDSVVEWRPSAAIEDRFIDEHYYTKQGSEGRLDMTVEDLQEFVYEIEKSERQRSEATMREVVEEILELAPTELPSSLQNAVGFCKGRGKQEMMEEIKAIASRRGIPLVDKE